MAAELVINHYLNKYKTLANTMSDISFDNLPFIYVKEPIVDVKGQRLSKSYFDRETNKEAVKIAYEKLIDDYEGVSNVFIGIKKTINYLDWSGEIALKKEMQPYYFNLAAVYDLQGSNIISYSSLKQQQIIQQERQMADFQLKSRNPSLYAILYNKYKINYDHYLLTGDKAALVEEINTETDTTILDFLNKIVVGTANTTVKELIFMTLQ